MNDGKVENPVAHGTDSVGLSSDCHRIELGGVEPREGKPCGAEECDEEVKTESGTFGALGVTGEQTSESDEHGSGLTNGSPQEERTTSDLLDEQERGEGKERVDDRKDTTEDEGQLSVEADLVLEQDGRVVDDRVTSTELLEDLSRGTDNSTTEVLLLSALEHITLPSGLGAGLSLERIDNLVCVGDSDGVVNGTSIESSDDSSTLVHLAVRNEPSRGLGKNHDTANKDKSEQDLESDRESPRDRAVNKGQAEVDPVRNDCADSNGGSLHANEETTVVGFGGLSDP